MGGREVEAASLSGTVGYEVLILLPPSSSTSNFYSFTPSLLQSFLPSLISFSDPHDFPSFFLISPTASVSLPLSLFSFLFPHSSPLLLPPSLSLLLPHLHSVQGRELPPWSQCISLVPSSACLSGSEAEGDSENTRKKHLHTEKGRNV